MGENNQESILGTTGAAGEPELTPEQIAEEAKAEEEFISAPEDTVTNPLVPEEASQANGQENVLEGAIGSGSLQTEIPQENINSTSNESNMQNGEGMQNNEVPATNAKTTATEPISPAEPIAGPAPVEPVPAAETAGMSSASRVYEEPKKKSKKGLVIGLVIGILLLVGGGVAVVILMMMQGSPKDSVNNALANFFNAENVKISGTMTGMPMTSSEFDMGEMTLDIEGVKSGNKIGGSGTMKAKLGDADINLKFNAAYADGDDVYFKLEGIKDIMSAVSLGSLFGQDLSSSSSFANPIIDSISEKFDGQWYKISMSDIDGGGESNCMASGMLDLLTSDSGKAISEAYKKSPVYVIDEKAEVKEENGVKYYTIVVDEKNKDAFVENTKSIDGIKKISECSEKNKGSSNSNALSADSANIQIGIKNGTNELAAIKIKGEGDAAMDLAIKYEKADVEVPNDAKPFSSFKEELESALQQVFMQSILGGLGGGNGSSLFGGSGSGSGSSSLFDLDDLDFSDPSSLDSGDYSDLLNLFN